LAGAAAAALAVAFLVNFLQQTSRLAFADVLENVRQVQSVKMKTHTVLQMGGQTVTYDGIQFIDEADHRLRQEADFPQGPVINIFNMKAGKALMTTPQNKVATRLDLAHIPKSKAPNDWLTMLKKVQESPAKDIGEKEFDGRKLHGFAISDTQDETTYEMNVWV